MRFKQKAIDQFTISQNHRNRYRTETEQIQTQNRYINKTDTEAEQKIEQIQKQNRYRNKTDTVKQNSSHQK